MKKAKDSDNINEIKEKTSKLSEAIQKAGAQMYKSSSGQDKSKDDSKDNSQENGDKGKEEGEYKEK